MENKKVGYIILGIAILMIFVIFLFNNALKEIVSASCTELHGDFCPMYDTISQQTYLALSLVAILVVIGIVLLFAKPREKIVIKKVKEKISKVKIDTSDLKPEEKKLLKIVEDNKAIFQADIVDKTGFGKAKVTRIIDRLEGKGIVERKRRGMNNIVVLK